MDFDRTHTDRQLLGDLRVGLPLDEQAQHLVFTFGELLREQFLSRGRFTVQVSKQADHDFTVQERFSPQDAPNRGNQFGLRYVFEHKTRGACLERLDQVLGFFVHGDENDAGPRAFLLNAATRGQSVAFIGIPRAYGD